MIPPDLALVEKQAGGFPINSHHVEPNSSPSTRGSRTADREGFYSSTSICSAVVTGDNDQGGKWYIGEPSTQLFILETMCIEGLRV